MTLETDIQQVKPFTSLTEKSIVNIIFTNNFIQYQYAQLLKKYDLTSAQYNVLRILQGQNGKPIGINDIIEKMLDKMSNASRLVDKLQSKDLASRTINRNSKRGVNVKITEVGQRLLKQVNIEIQRMTIGSKLNILEMEQLNSLLDKFRI